MKTIFYASLIILISSCIGEKKPKTVFVLNNLTQHTVTLKFYDIQKKVTTINLKPQSLEMNDLLGIDIHDLERSHDSVEFIFNDTTKNTIYSLRDLTKDHPFNHILDALSWRLVSKDDETIVLQYFIAEYEYLNAL